MASFGFHPIAPFILTHTAKTEINRNSGSDKSHVFNISTNWLRAASSYCKFHVAKIAIVGFSRAAGAALGADSMRVN
ncbi:hypothetical protein [Bradyrhizobium sacchari]|uniref:hypothetical protein n=1 Tax=Bradyrhizobium sacchari TaxID=1399419 RepID=UPI0010A9697A|nr:hypothetical protein [Bradyrhizobium sacchari]